MRARFVLIVIAAITLISVSGYLSYIFNINETINKQPTQEATSEKKSTITDQNKTFVDEPLSQPPQITSVTSAAGISTVDLSGKISKTFNGPILSSHTRFLDTNTTDYRITHVTYWIDYSELHPDESVESDVCLDILNATTIGSLTSGEEALCSHESHVGNKPGNISDITIPGNGLALIGGKKLKFAGVSQIYPHQITADRLTDNFLAVHYKITLVKLSDSPTYSQRSPFRDRSFVADPARKYAPYTNFINNNTEQTHVYGLGVFLSSISHYDQNKVTLQIWRNNDMMQEIPFFVHTRYKSDPKSSDIILLNMTLAPKDIISVRAEVQANKSQVYDFASFIFSDKPLVRVNETTLFPNYVDLNNDGYPDYMDYDAQHEIWADTTRGDQYGVHDTQFEWAYFIPPFKSITISDKTADVMHIITKNSACLNLVRNETVLHYRFIIHYCDESKVPQIKNREQVAWGDFNGDGFLDRLRIDPVTRTFNVSLGGPEGLQTEQIWFTGDGTVDKFFVETINNHSVFYAEWANKRMTYEEDNGKFRKILLAQ